MQHACLTNSQGADLNRLTQLSHSAQTGEITAVLIMSWKCALQAYAHDVAAEGTSVAGVELGSRGLSMAFVSREVHICSYYLLADIAPLTHMPQQSSSLLDLASCFHF